MRNLFLILFFSWISICSAQSSIANYTTARTTGNTYNSITASGNAFDSWRNTGALPQDDNRSDFTDIGFDFWYNGIRYTQFSVSTNGYMDFSASTDDGGPTADDYGYQNTAFSNATVASGTYLAIAPFYDDLTAQGGTGALGNSIKYLVTGSAPNRILTVEWINMAVYGNTSPSLNYQVKVYETTGVIEINYGTMTQGTAGFTYTMGINGPTISNPPTALQMKVLQTVNTNTFSNTVRNNLSTMPTAGSRYTFTPPTPTVAAGTLTFSGVTSTGMTLNWPNWATNERGYVIYNSTDGVNYSFVSQAAANATSTAVTGLLPGTTYFWRLYAVTEGCLSGSLSGTQATLPAGNVISIATGFWDVGTTWSSGAAPTASDNVTVTSTHTVTIRSAAICNNLTVGQGQAAVLQIGNNTTVRTVTVNNDVTVTGNATFNVNAASNATHTATFKGNIINNGTLNFATDAASLCNATFNKNGSQTISGTGATTTFNNIVLNQGTSINNTLDITTPTFVAPNNFLTLTTGTFKLSTTGASVITPYTAAVTIPQKGAIWLNSSASTINFGATVTMYGNITVSNGIMNIGNAADEDLISNGGLLTTTGGTLNIASKYYATGINNLSKFTINSGTVVVPSVSSTNTTTAPFQITGAGSQFNMTGGTLIIPREGGTGAQNLGFINTGATGGTVTGGTLQIGNASSPAAQIIQINSTYPVGNLTVSSANVTAGLLTNSLNVINDVTLTTGILTANNLNITLGGNWANNGGTFTPGTGTVTFNGTTAQTIFKTGGETFNNMFFSNAGVKTLNSPVTANGSFTINAAANFDVDVANHLVTIKGDFSNNGTLTVRNGNIFLNGTTAQNIGGTTITDFYDLTLNNAAGASLLQDENIVNSLVLNGGVFNVNARNFTLVSTATGSGRIAQITGTGDISGNVIVQRYAPGGFTGWAFLGAPLTSALTYTAWDDDMPISCNTCPDGSAAGFLSIYTYDETASGLYDDPASYIPISTINDPITNGTGYWVYFGDGYTTTNNITLDVTGTPRKFNYTIPLNYTNTGAPTEDGWNLISNPYPSPILWTALRGATAGIDNAIYVYNADLSGGAGSYATFVNGISSPAIGSGGVDNNIPICQGFYVHSTGATALNAQESNKVSGNPTFLRQNPYNTNTINTQAPELIRLYLDGPATYHDETVLYLQNNANNTFDPEYDSYKLAGSDPLAPSIALQNDTDLFQINGVAPITSNFSMPVRAITGYAGTYTITADNVSSFPSGACISLYDNYTGITTDLRNNAYSFSLSDTTQAARFTLNITINPLQVNTITNDPTCNLPNSGQIIAVGNNSGPWNYYWKDVNGLPIKTSLNKSDPDTLETLSGGVYVLEINTVGNCDNNVTQFGLNSVDVTIASFSSMDTLYLGLGANTNITNTSVNAVVNSWNFGDGFGVSNDYQPTYQYLVGGIYSITLITESSTGCLDTATHQVVIVNDILGIKPNSSEDITIKTLSENVYLVQQKLPVPQQISATLVDALGKELYHFGTSTTNTVNLNIDLSAFESGVYYLKLSKDKEIETIKLVKQ
ncbi:MAG: T9SS type A sorting domain-containing protein [Bacteroidota bacterium]|nr:T9SS type A sorting domain-containing protein [Bacteroidota bacterium]